MMAIVVDASIAMKWVLEKRGRDAAEEILEKQLGAPSLCSFEVTNASCAARLAGS